jgi:methylated-DNA-protein-cysteine methyltransferase-like protein
MSDKQFAERVFYLVAQIPKGRLMTYGQIAGLCGNARASRIVGGIAHFGPPDLPWQRVVNKEGGLASGYPGGREGHKKDLQAEGIEVFDSEGDYRVDIDKLIWHPHE